MTAEWDDLLAAVDGLSHIWRIMGRPVASPPPRPEVGGARFVFKRGVCPWDPSWPEGYGRTDYTPRMGPWS